ncbi:tRNA-5-taurinomethyluridine 2-sulfurtransferase KNAG_0K01750 [Huiozyma naganishii CBS 8797]|uniref:tRNA-5-taurinomethyluridine 2-sulfurtransferase n=1 Tax=Huiozyma naganishii (strain ATCC MYA-139 / BCRC 22969 / CBS 8797 / KCTC 17520 / NBRC 10181 / NCYC 3082 / Yp74L-3) TaxID=1071383 RepID=J7RCF3_HUIN7|nr:hypothetical protein KNAG_0K01750 [Kazachstania naganishii CBS 8797]CCK72540.1 hypothetical protein KNAG_0K01750 [Kazachstania naganishii CBS 8797]
MFARYSKALLNRIPEGFKQAHPDKFDNVVVAMSSGVDSSVAASIFSSFPNATGVYMRNWSSANNDNENPKHCDEQDWKDAFSVARYLGIPIELMNFEKDYWIDVFEPMLNGYAAGGTPNPDILCNRFIKFGKLREALDLKYGTGNYWLVMGHYSRILEQVRDHEFQLWRGLPSGKDQSYYLSQLKPEILPNVILPIGHFLKSETRQFARELNLPVADKPDSQGICFVNNSQQGKFKNFLREYLPNEPGNIITLDPATGEKTVWGRHDGLWSYTVGQKIGIPMPQGKGHHKGAWFVSQKFKDTNEIVIVPGGVHTSLYRDSLSISGFRHLLPTTTTPEQLLKTIQDAIRNSSLYMQYRSLQEPIPVVSCSVATDPSATLLPSFQLTLATPQRAMAQGQYGCLYINDRVLGSGSIE